MAKPPESFWYAPVEEPDAAQLLAKLNAAQEYVTGEKERLKNPSFFAPDVVPDLTPFPHTTMSVSSVRMEIEPGYVDRFDAPMALAILVGLAPRGFLRTNSREAPKILGQSRWYVRADWPRLAGHPRVNIQVNRLVRNAGPFERVHEHPEDHHNHLPEVLRVTASQRRGLTRSDAVAAASRHFGALPELHMARRAYSVAQFAELLWDLFAIADARWHDRAVRDAVAVAPEQYPGLLPT